MKFAVLYARAKAKELDAASLSVLQEAEPTENDPAHAAWGIKINYAAKNTEIKLMTFLHSEADDEVTTQVNLGAKKKKQKLDNTNPTINKVKELIDRLNKKKNKNAIYQCFLIRFNSSSVSK
jgi:hypothetical protein